MTIYDTRNRCVYCRRYDLPCNDAVHGNPLFPYVPLVETTNVTADMARRVPVIYGPDPTVRMATPAPAKRTRADRARALSTVALALIGLCAVIVTLVAYVAITGWGEPPCRSATCAPVQLVSVPPSPRPLPTDR